MRIAAGLLAAIIGSSALAAAPDPLPVPATKGEASVRYEEGRSAYKAGAFKKAGLAFDAAHAFFKDSNLLWNAGRAWERAKELELAQARYAAFLKESKLDEPARSEAEDALARVEAQLADVAQPDPVEPTEPIAPPERDHTASFVLIGAGGGVAVAGLVIAIVGQGELDDITAAQDRADDGVVTSISRKEALDLESSGTTLRTTGIVLSSLGLAAAATGVVLFFLDDSRETRGTTGVTVAPLRNGGAVMWSTAF